MIFGIVSANATGKTTFLKGLDIPGARKVFGDLVQVNYDLVPEFADSKYYRTKDGKIEFVEYMVRDHTTLWIVEGCRFWGSLIHHVIPAVRDIDGGLFMLVVTVGPDVMERMLRARAVQNNKEYRADYWDFKRRLYEGKHRAVNACRKHLYDYEWCRLEFTGDFSVWQGLPLELIKQFASDRTLWYYREPLGLVRRVPCT